MLWVFAFTLSYAASLQLSFLSAVLCANQLATYGLDNIGSPKMTFSFFFVCHVLTEVCLCPAVFAVKRAVAECATLVLNENLGAGFRACLHLCTSKPRWA